MRRRDFIVRGGIGVGAAAAVSSLGAEAAGQDKTSARKQGSKPVVISSRNGLKATETAMKTLKEGGSTLDAVIAGVNTVEEDPDDITVGYGGLPNERGEVELDACVMDGPSGRAGAVASLQKIKYPSRVARRVMEQTDHVLIVGPGALEFARAHGFREENLLTERTRKIWLWWKQTHSEKDDWIPLPKENWPEEVKDYVRTHGTIHCSALDEEGRISCVTSTSGLSFKIPGRVGDSPLVGAGLYVDNDIGSCGSTGRGEEVILSCGSFAVVEQLRHGMTPLEAGLEILKRVHDRALKLPRLLDDDGKPNFNVNFYVLDKEGRHAGCSLWSGSTYSLHDGSKSRHLESAYLLKRKPRA
jgi:N4-(beta-N-acetylglucosaminyl)-L-asparaginase